MAIETDPSGNAHAVHELRRIDGASWNAKRNDTTSSIRKFAAPWLIILRLECSEESGIDCRLLWVVVGVRLCRVRVHGVYDEVVV